MVLVKLNYIGGIAFRASKHRLGGLAALDWKKGDEEKGEVVDPANFLEHLRATTFGAIVFPHSPTVYLDLSGFCAKNDEHW